ncbi:hypothetical protein ABZ746_14240 [Streptomyces sp. NPDC020096]
MPSIHSASAVGKYLRPKAGAGTGRTVSMSMPMGPVGLNATATTPRPWLTLMCVSVIAPMM